VRWNLGVVETQTGDAAILTIKSFESQARIRGRDTRGGIETFAMLMFDYNYDGKIFSMDRVVYAHEIQNNDWQATIPLNRLGKSIMVVFIDIYCNEARELIARDSFDTVLNHQNRTQSRKARN
jgi:hypothetical protein